MAEPTCPTGEPGLPASCPSECGGARWPRSTRSPPGIPPSPGAGTAPGGPLCSPRYSTVATQPHAPPLCPEASASPSQARRVRGRGGAAGETLEEGPPHRGGGEAGGWVCPPRAGAPATRCPRLRGKVPGDPEPPAAGGVQGRLPGPAGGIHGAARGGPCRAAEARGAGGSDGPAAPARHEEDGFGLPGKAAALRIPEEEADAHQGADPGV